MLIVSTAVSNGHQGQVTGHRARRLARALDIRRNESDFREGSGLHETRILRQGFRPARIGAVRVIGAEIGRIERSRRLTRGGGGFGGGVRIY